MDNSSNTEKRSDADIIAHASDHVISLSEKIEEVLADYVGKDDPVLKHNDRVLIVGRVINLVMGRYTNQLLRVMKQFEEKMNFNNKESQNED